MEAGVKYLQHQYVKTRGIKYTVCNNKGKRFESKI